MEADPHALAWPVPPQSVIAAMGGTPAAAGADDGVLSAERLRYELEQAYFNDTHLLAPLAYFVLGLDSAILQLNLAAAELLGIERCPPASRDPHPPAHFHDFVCAAFRRDFDRLMRRALNGAAPVHLSLQLSEPRRPHGFPVTLHASADAAGQYVRVTVEPAEGRLAALEQSEARLRRMVHSAEEGIWELDAAACTSFVNPKMAQMLGCRIEDMLKRPLHSFMDEEGRAILERNIGRRRDGVAERHEFKFIRADGSALWATLETHPIFDGAGVYRGALALVSDISAGKCDAERIWRQANFDALTALPNRHLLLDRLASEAARARRENRPLALLFVDLDHFKQVNDLLGHERGDTLLAEAGRRIAACVRATDTVARLGGDEFTVLLPSFGPLGNVERVAQQIIGQLARPFALDGESATISASVGIAVYPDDAGDTETLLRHADQAMYAAKHAGRNQFRYFTPELQRAALQRSGIAGELRQALAARQFELHYQPIVDLRSGAVGRAEALLRWRHPQRGLLAPAAFLAGAAASGLMGEIGDWVFRQAVQQAGRWQSEFDPAFQISVNQSCAQLRADGAGQDWIACLAEHGLAPGSIMLDVTEDALLGDAQRANARLHALRAGGLQVALDDFGTGYGSLSCLKQSALDVLKIDQSFVHELEANAGDMALCEAIIALAHKLGLKVVAEGVETAQQRRLLAAAGCDYAQGYVFAAALPAAQFGLAARAATAAALA